MSAKHENIMDEIREQSRKFKDMSPRQKLEYFWEYYKFPTLAILCAVIFGISLIRSIIENNKETVVYTAFINANLSLSYEDMSRQFADRMNVDLDDVFVTIDSGCQLNPDMSTQEDLAGMQKLMAMSASNQIDVLMADEPSAMKLAGNGYYADLRTVLPQELLKKYEDYIVYYTYDPDAKRAEMEAAGLEYEEESKGPFETLEPVPIGISGKAFQDMNDAVYYGLPTVAGICISSMRTENAAEFIDFLSEYHFPEEAAAE